MKFERIKRIIKNPRKIILGLLTYTASIWPDKLYLQLRYYLEMGQILNIKNPHTFNEKLQWLKLYNRRPEYTTMVDKYAVKQYVADIIGEEYIIPTLGIWNKFNEINFEDLPNQFVLKCTHDSGGLIICKDKSKLNIDDARKKIEASLQNNYYPLYKEWPYKNVPPRIIAEQYLKDGDEELEDYKVHNFNGEPKFILVCRNRFKDSPLVNDFYSEKWELLDVRRPGHPNSLEPQSPPSELQEMLRLSKLLSKDIPFLRTDFYISNHKVFFGELTFFPAGGMVKFVPEEWDEIFGSYLKINLK